MPKKDPAKVETRGRKKTTFPKLAIPRADFACVYANYIGQVYRRWEHRTGPAKATDPTSEIAKGDYFVIRTKERRRKDYLEETWPWGEAKAQPVTLEEGIEIARQAFLDHPEEDVFGTIDGSEYDQRIVYRNSVYEVRFFPDDPMRKKGTPKAFVLFYSPTATCLTIGRGKTRNFAHLNGAIQTADELERAYRAERAGFRI